MPILRWNRNKMNACFECLKLFDSMAHSYTTNIRNTRRWQRDNDDKVCECWFYSIISHLSSFAISTVESMRSALVQSNSYKQPKYSTLSTRKIQQESSNDAVEPFNKYSKNKTTGSWYFHFIRVLQGRIPSIICWKLEVLLIVIVANVVGDGRLLLLCHRACECVPVRVGWIE